MMVLNDFSTGGGWRSRAASSSSSSILLDLLRRAGSCADGDVVLDRVRPYVLPLVVLVVTWIIIAAITPTFRGEASVFSVLRGLPAGRAGRARPGGHDHRRRARPLRRLDGGAGRGDRGGNLRARAGRLSRDAPSRRRCARRVQGTVIARLGINSLVFTIGTLILLRGLTYICLRQRADHDRQLRDHRSPARALRIFSLSSIIALVVFVAPGLFLTYTRWGREIFAIGGARNEAIAAGVPRRAAIDGRLRHLGRLRQPRRGAGRRAGRQRGAAELRGPAARRLRRGAARRHQPLRRPRHGAQRRARRGGPVRRRGRAGRARQRGVAGPAGDRRAAVHRDRARVHRRPQLRRGTVFGLRSERRIRSRRDSPPGLLDRIRRKARCQDGSEAARSPLSPARRPGIGSATARLFVAEGARVLAADIKEPGDELAAALDRQAPDRSRFEHARRARARRPGPPALRPAGSAFGSPTS